jgi:L-threonylcarbamoyladenylate synthase
MVERAEIERAARLIRAGELVAFPTETVYGLGANALDAAAVGRIYAVKGRPLTSPLIVHVSSVEMARGLAREWPETAAALVGRWWPGPLTVIVNKSEAVPDIVTAGLGTVGLRMPAHEVALALIEAAGVPVAGPSANLFSRVSPTTAEHVRAGLGEKVAMVLDGGACAVGIESTVVSVAGEEPVLLRPGMIAVEELEQVTGRRFGEFRREGKADPAPGMTARHYSPETPLYIGAPRAGRGAYVYWKERAVAAEVVAMPASAWGYAAALYDVLHRLDKGGWEWIAVEPVPETGEWAGVADRLRRAAAGRK